MTFRRRGPVTRDTSVFHSGGSVSCRISTNKWTADEYFTVSENHFRKLEGKHVWVNNSHAHLGGTHYQLQTKHGGKTVLLHSYLYPEESVGSGLTVDHVLHWTDNRPESVEFVTRETNSSRGAALFHNHVKQHRGRR